MPISGRVQSAVAGGVVAFALSVAGCGSSSASPGNFAPCASDSQDADGDGTCSPRCSAATCGDHGTCDDASGTATCTCAAGYVGDACATCTTCATCPVGTQDVDGDGTCQPACTTTTCGAGACDHRTGAIACTCPPDRTGSRCEACAPGLQDLDHDGTCAPSCTVSRCRGRGTCSDATGTASCACAAGYAGDDCERCADGYQDENQDGVCLPACSETTCGGHGTCDASSGARVCTCDVGYAGPRCGTCAPTHQDRDGDGTCAPACDDTTCNVHGACSDRTGAAVCTCSAAYTGATCAACAPGFQDADRDGTCAVACGAIECVHGACDPGPSGATCTCSGGFVGPRCDVCATGTQDNDHDGTCAPACMSGACGSHGTCSDASGTAECVCAEGYAGAACAACATGFQDNDHDGSCLQACSASSCGDREVCGDGTGAIRCACAAGLVGDDCEFRRVYGLDIPQTANWDTYANVPYDVDASASARAFDRVAYRFTLDANWVWAEMDPFTDVVRDLGVPVDVPFDGVVSRLTVRSNHPRVTSIENSPSGSLEFWSDCFDIAPGTWDSNDTRQEYRPDCYGTMQVFAAGTSVFTYGNWSGAGNSDVGIGPGPTGNPDWTFTNQSVAYPTRRLEVFVRDVRTCSSSTCSGHGTCDDATGLAVCTCDALHTGVNCATCAPGANDADHDGVCEADCGGGTCDGLHAATGLPTGDHPFRLKSGVVPLHVDGTTSGGGWILVGRGREGWDFMNAGKGRASTVKDGLGTSAAFAPNYLAGSLVQSLVDATVPARDARGIEVRIHRATDAAGTAYQDVTWKFTTIPTWDWQFDQRNSAITWSVAASALGGAVSGSGTTRHTSASTGAALVTTSMLVAHGSLAGFAYGNGVNGGSNAASNFLWTYATEGSPVPYTEVYVRVSP